MDGSDFKISADVELNLQKMDASLNTAVTKAAQAGQKIQQALSGGGGHTGASPIATPAASGPGVSGHAVSFGVGLNVQPGNTKTILEQNARDARNARDYRTMQMRQALGIDDSPSGIEGMLLKYGSPMGGAVALATAGIATANKGVSYALESARNQDALVQFKTLQSSGASFGRGDEVRLAKQSLDNMQVPGLLGLVPGVNTLARNFILAGSARARNLDMLAQSEDRYGSSRRTTLQGYGGFVGQMRVLEGEAQEDQRRVNTLRNIFPEQADKLQTQLDSEYALRSQQLMRSNSMDRNSLETQAKVSRLNALGMRGLSSLMSIKNEYANMRLATGPEDMGWRGPLIEQAESAANMEAFMGMMKPAQTITPGTVATGPNAVGIGSPSGQDPAVMAQLMSMDMHLDKITNGFIAGRN